MKTYSLHSALESFTKTKSKETLDFALSSSFLPPHDAVREKMKRTIDDPDMFTYSVADYENKFKDHISLLLLDKYGIKVEKDQIFPGSGTKQLIAYILLSLVKNGEKVLTPSPGYPAYSNIIENFNYTPIEYSTLSEAGEITSEIITKLKKHKPKLIVLNFPSNPTGKVLSKDQLLDIVNVASDHGTYILHDNILDDFIFKGSPVSLFTFNKHSDKIIELVSFSKFYGMSGVRLGCSYSEKQLASKIKAARQMFEFNVPIFSLSAGVSALEESKNNPIDIKDYVFKNLEMIAGVFTETDTQYIHPDAGISVIANVPDTLNMNSVEFCEKIYFEYGVKILPGTIYSEEHINKFRVTLMNTHENVFKFTQKYKQMMSEHGK